MSCGGVRRRLSAYRDSEFSLAESRAVSDHLEACPACAEAWRSLREALSLVASAPRLRPSEPIAARVLDRLEVESRGPGLALLFRSALAARPLMLPSLVPAALVLVAVLAAAVVLDRGSGSGEPVALGAGPRWDAGVPPSGTEGNPLLLSAGVSLPQVRGQGRLTADVVADLGEANLFVETVVARDGSVSLVRLLEGDSERAQALLDFLRRERFEPGRYRGRPVAVSVYRLISSLEVRPPLT